MKKLFIISFLLVSCLLSFTFIAHAESYQNYQEIVFDNDDAKLLKEFSSSDYSKYYKRIKRKRFFGWKIYVANKNEPVEFISETKLKIYNNGFSTIKHDISLKSEAETKYQLSASGEIKIKGSGDVKKFKGSLDADIKAAVSYTSKKTETESYKFNIVVDPKTYVKIVTRGKGEVSNGVGNYYWFWIRTKRGGWETFTVQTEYYEIIKDRI